MSTLSEAAASAAVPSGVTTRDYLVATDGTPDSDGAVRVGLALARRDGVRAELYSVVEPPPLVELDGTPIPDVEELVAFAREARSSGLLAQRDRTHPANHDWPFTIETGPRAEAIVARANRLDASMILLGLGAHGVGARLSMRETALRVIRAANRPVLALPGDGWGVPHSVLAALDFTESSEYAARVALELLGGEGTLYLAHVTPRTAVPHRDTRAWGESEAGAMIPRLHDFASRLRVPPNVRVEFVALYGDPTHELTAFAEQVRIDLISVGTHGRSTLGRLVLGSVSTKLIRTARSWVLVAPPHPVV